MTQLVPIRLEDGTEIYMEATDDVVAPPSAPDPYAETTRTAKGLGMTPQAAQVHAAQSFKAIESTIRTYTSYTMNAFKDMATANVEKVTLEFGLKVGGEAGVPYVTKGTAESNLKITVECSFN
ncbi:CU044_2847 family protein [Nodosilinea sp. E11]|uniref:CU044_2847 family protein n=1 Tax=Nodosilinea sp. E11 TaxID=3037479 RepID=UPI00293424B2|nr:CU044_2847 family protein [Nodosilinea sp. E11]WOD37754.1 CU044_2847 family protein [Nodosilinea sp. E11]